MKKKEKRLILILIAILVVVLIIGFIQTHRAIKRKYKDEIETNKANA